MQAFAEDSANHTAAKLDSASTTDGLFTSFWLAGFESACQINTCGQRIDMIAGTQHDTQVNHDYALLRSMGISTARDGIRWHLIEKRPGHYDFSSLTPMLNAAQNQGLQIIWNILHYGWPDDLNIFSPDFISRFAHFCSAVALHVAENTSGVPFYSPINEISFLSWAIGYKCIIYPFAAGRDVEVKRQLIRAAIAGCEAIWEIDPRARVVHIDPVIQVFAPRDRPDLAGAAAAQSSAQFDAWDMLSGRKFPELGGQPKYLDILGINYYHSNQFEHPDVRLRWEDDPRDDRWVPLHQLLREFHERFRRPFFVAETSHFGEGRARWIREIADEIYTARLGGTPVLGVCIYPILDRHDWENPDHWHNSGLWDLVPDLHGKLLRVLQPQYAEALRNAHAKLRCIDCR